MTEKIKYNISKLCIGDKLLCKKEPRGNKRFGYVNYSVGNFYYVSKIEVHNSHISKGEFGITVSGETDHKYATCKFYNFKFEGMEHYIFDYFYSPKEIRKLKLEKIESGR